MLSAARARAGAILTTGANIRAEPTLSHEPFGAGAQALREWRRARITRGIDIPPHTVVLTRDASLDLTHPLFRRTSGTAHVLTDRAGALGLRQRAQQLADGRAALNILELRGRALAHPISPIVFASSLPLVQRTCESGPPRVVTAATNEVAHGARLPSTGVLLECGIATARPLYYTGVVDELLLSVYRGPLDISATGKPFLSWKEIRGYFGAEEVCRGMAQQYSVRAQPSPQLAQGSREHVTGTWSFLRFCCTSS